MKKRIILKNIFLLFILLLFVSFQFWGDIYDRLVHEPISMKIVKDNNLILNVEHLQYSRSTMIYKNWYTVIIGKDNDGNEKAVWLDFKKSRLKPEIYHVVELHVTQNEALYIAEQSNLLDEINYIDLIYLERSFDSVETGTYWRIYEKSGKYIYIDIILGTVIYTFY